LLIKYIKSVLWRVAKCLSYIEEARCLKVNGDDTNMNIKGSLPDHTERKLLTDKLDKTARR